MTDSFDRLFALYDSELERAKQATQLIGLPNWTLSGALFYTLTLLTTIGYGAFAPVTLSGRAFTVLFGIVAIVLATACIGLFIASLDALIERLVLRATRLPCCRLRQSDASLLRLRLAASTLLLVAYMCVLAWFGRDHCGPTSTSMPEDATFLDAIYFAFQTMSTVGLGDLYCGDVRLADAVAQVVLVIPGVVVFSEFLNLAVEAWELLLATLAGYALRMLGWCSTE